MNPMDMFDQLLDMIGNHPFWALLTLAVLLWYSSVTIYVGVRGILDIKHMLRTLADQQSDGGQHPEHHS